MISERGVFLFEDYAFDANEKILRVAANNEIISMPPKTCELLAFFVENAGRLLSKDELLEKVWAETFVEESNLSHHIAVLRKNLNENGERKFIETIPKKGYRFVAPVVPREKIEIVVTETTETRTVEEEIESPENPLIGREREISVIKNLLRRGDTRILTLTGVGGAGKTSLARAVSDEISAEFSGGAWFVDLSSVRDSSLVTATVAQNLNIKAAAEETAFEAVKNYLHKHEILLVLDNFEQILEAASDVAKLSGRASKILVTSRTRLHLSCEREFQIPPLEFPVRENLPEELIEYAAVRLFVERARNQKANFDLTDENASAVAEICRKLEGLPLAIELAAARIRLMPPRAILEKLASQLRFLTGKTRDLPARQQTMRAAINWSYELLNEDERRFFASLAVFSGGFTLEAAENVFAEEFQTPDVGILEIIETLAEHNLLNADETANGEMRFRFLEAIREFASEKFAESENFEVVRRKHAAYFLDFAELTEPQIRTKNAAEAYSKFKTENENMRLALAFFEKRDAEKYLRAATAMCHFWATHGFLDEGRARIEDALEKERNADFRLLAAANKGAAIIAARQSDFAAAENFNREILRLAELLDDDYFRAVAENGLGTIAYLNGETDAAEMFFERALKNGRESGEDALMLSIIVGLSETKRLKKNWRAARELTEKSLEIIVERGLKRPFVGAHLNLGAISVMEGDAAAAEKSFQTASENNLEGDQYAASFCLDGFAAVAAVRDQTERALELSAEAKKIRDEANFQLELPDCIFRQYYLEMLNRKSEEKKTSR